MENKVVYQEQVGDTLYGVLETPFATNKYYSGPIAFDAPYHPYPIDTSTWRYFPTVGEALRYFKDRYSGTTQWMRLGKGSSDDPTRD